MKSKNIILAVIATVGVILDQWSKYWAVETLKGQAPITIIEHYFDFIYIENKGAAWGMFSNLSDGFRIPFFVAISIVAIGFIGYFFKKIQDSQRLLIVALSFILSGAVGNFIDRIVNNAVVDFIDWHYYHHHWPTFNVADILISVGVGMLVIEMILNKGELPIFDTPKKQASESSTDTNSES